MKLAVCFKTIHDYAMVPPEDWQTTGRNTADPGLVRQVFNCYEESALEMALALGNSQRSSGPVSKNAVLTNSGEASGPPLRIERTALTVDDSRADLFLRHLIAVGYDRAVRVAPDRKLDFSPETVAAVLATWGNGSDPPDLMIFGPRGGAGEHCQIGPLVAEMLGWPCLMSVAALEFDDRRRLRVTCRKDRSCRIHVVVPPLVLVTGIATETHRLRIPTLKQKLDARNRAIQVLSLADMDLSRFDSGDKPPSTDLVGVPKSHRTCTMIHGDNPQEKAQMLADNYLKLEQVP
jgi:electron transfer flavoprotein alpha/beta subunit